MMEVIQPRTRFTLTAEPRDVVSFRHHFPHQHFQPHVAQGPSFNPNFRNRAWTFNVEGVDMRLTSHRDDPPSVKKAVVSELESLFLGALNQCVTDGASENDLVHINLDCSGLEYRFQFNPSGPHAVTLGTLLADNGLHTVLEMFAQLIQSGKDVFIDQHTKLKVYTFAPPEPVGLHTRFFTADMSTFLKSSKSVVEIKNNKNNMCFSFAYVLGLAHLKEDQSLYTKL